jgi:hypothetical protein
VRRRPSFHLYTIVFTIVRVLVYAIIENLYDSLTKRYITIVYSIAWIVRHTYYTIAFTTIAWIAVTIAYYTIVLYGV